MELSKENNLILKIKLPNENRESINLGPVCFRFFGSRFSENQNSEISQLPEESAV